MPSPPKGFHLDNVPSKGVCLFVLAGCSLRDHPRLFMLSLNEDDAMAIARRRLERG